MAGLGEINVAQTEPLPDEVLRKGSRFGGTEHPFDLVAKHLGMLQSSRHAPRAVASRGTRSVPATILGEGEQFFIRHRTPEEIRQPAGQRKIIELARLFIEKQERG